jgi:hypothetical protein
MSDDFNSPKKTNEDLDGVDNSNGFRLKVRTEYLIAELTRVESGSIEHELALHLPIHSKNKTNKNSVKY